MKKTFVISSHATPLLKSVKYGATVVDIKFYKDSEQWRLIIWEGEGKEKNSISSWPAAGQWYRGSILKKTKEIEAWLRQNKILEDKIALCLRKIVEPWNALW